MKKILAVLILSLTAVTAQAQWHGGYRGGYGPRGPVVVYNNNGYHGGWVAPALAGVVVGAALARPYYAPPPVVYTPPPVYVQPGYPAGYVQQTIFDANCSCYRTVLVPQ